MLIPVASSGQSVAAASPGGPFVGASAFAFGTGTTATPLLPSGLADNDLLVAVIGTTGDLTTTMTPPSGWASAGGGISAGTGAQTDRRIFLFHRVRDGTESDLDFDLSSSEGHSSTIVAFRGYNVVRDPGSGFSYSDMASNYNDDTTPPQTTDPASNFPTDAATGDLMVSYLITNTTTTGVAVPSGATAAASTTTGPTVAVAYQVLASVTPTVEDWTVTATLPDCSAGAFLVGPEA